MCTAPRTADLLFSSFTVDTRHSLYSALSFLFLSLGINIKVKELYRACFKEHKSFCSLPYSLALKLISALDSLPSECCCCDSLLEHEQPGCSTLLHLGCTSTARGTLLECESPFPAQPLGSFSFIT